MSNNAIEQAEKIVRELEDKRECMHARTKTLIEQRKQLAYAANAGDKKSREKLNAINSEVAHHNTDIENLEFALVEARARLDQAKAAVVSAADRDRALQVAALNEKLKQELEDAHDAFTDAITSVLNARKLLQDMHALGIASPTDQMARINFVVCIKSVLQELPVNFTTDFEFSRLAPNQKRNFKSLAGTWHDQIENQIAPRLGEQPKKTEAA